MSVTTCIFVTQNVVKLLILTHTCLKTYQRVHRLYRWVAPPAVGLWNSFVFVDVVPVEYEYVVVPAGISAARPDGGEARGLGRGRDPCRFVSVRIPSVDNGSSPDAQTPDPDTCRSGIFSFT